MHCIYAHIYAFHMHMRCIYTYMRTLLLPNASLRVSTLNNWLPLQAKQDTQNNCSAKDIKIKRNNAFFQNLEDMQWKLKMAVIYRWDLFLFQHNKSPLLRLGLFPIIILYSFSLDFFRPLFTSVLWNWAMELQLCTISGMRSNFLQTLIWEEISNITSNISNLHSFMNQVAPQHSNFNIFCSNSHWLKSLCSTIHIIYTHQIFEICH